MLTIKHVTNDNKLFTIWTGYKVEVLDENEKEGHTTILIYSNVNSDNPSCIYLGPENTIYIMNPEGKTIETIRT